MGETTVDPEFDGWEASPEDEAEIQRRVERLASGEAVTRDFDAFVSEWRARRISSGIEPS